MVFIIAQIIGFIAFFFSLIAYHKNKKEKILGNMIISNGLNLIHYVLLGALSGGATKVLAILRDITIISKKKYKFLSSNVVLSLFVIMYIVIGIIFYSSVWSVLPILSAIVYTIPLWNGNELIVKKAAYLSRILWLIYNIVVFSISGIVTDSVFIISTFIAYKNTKKHITKS